MGEADDNRLWNQLLELIPTGVGVFDFADQKICMEYLNDGYYQMIHATRKQRAVFWGTGVIDAIYQDDVKGLMEEVRAAIAEERMLQYRFRLLTGMGNYMWVAIRANHIKKDDGDVRFFVAYYDMDEVIHMQEKMQDCEILQREFVRYSEALYFSYYPGEHRYAVIFRPESQKSAPVSLNDYPESFIRKMKPDRENAEKYREMIRKIDNGAQEAECTFCIPAGEKKRWIRVHMWGLPGRGEDPVRAIGSQIDVTGYVKAEQAFNDEQKKMQSLQGKILAVSCFNVSKDMGIDLSDDYNLGYNRIDKDTLYQEALESDPQIVLQNRETLDILLKVVEQVPDREERINFIRTYSNSGLLRKYADGERESKLTYRRWTKRGILWVETRVVLLRNPDTGDIVAFFYSSDVNDRMIYNKLTTQLLMQDYKSFSYYDVSSGKFFVNPDPSEKGTEFTEYPYEDAVLDEIDRCVIPSEKIEVQKKYVIENILSKLTSVKIYEIYYTCNERDRSISGYPHRKMKCDIFYLDAGRDIIIFAYSDVTGVCEQERKKREKMTREMQALAVAGNAKTEFVARISHDIRTPISIISNMTDFAYEDIHDEEKLRYDLDRIKAANHFLLNLINDVLDISQIDSGKIRLNPEPYTYEEHAAYVRNVLEPLCEKKELKCVISQRTNKGIIVADKIRINQIILNLISNAVKYTPKGGMVSYISHSEDLPDDKIRYSFEIKDTGIGMSRDFQKHMFDSFVQEYDNPARAKNIQGTGIGLSIVKKMLDLMDGTITVKSEIGKGTSISCSIVFPDALRDPKYRKKVKLMQKSNAEYDKLTGRILLAEDNLINTEIAVRILEKLGLTVECVQNGEEAVKLFEKKPEGYYRAVLMDIQMQIMNGYEATRKIRAMKKADAATIPIIAMTADAFSDAVQKGRDCGMSEYLIKPIDPAGLYGVLQKAFGRSDSIS